ncbi:hypothetical protein BJV82DRAFT_621434 [Fennellomyces sp. T-0311]|nr:hypothetical protein BJV82DRAFT_621434 [Fennellomyces sp. T-0311]
MLILKFNTLSAHDLFAIERRLLRWQNRRPSISLTLNVLDYGRTDIYGHLLGLFAELHVLDALDISPSQLLDFFIDVDTTYLNAPYHSFYHAVDIVTMLYYMLIELEAEQYLSRLDIAVLLLAALCHDAGHPGYNNLYQVNFKTELASRYSNTSVLESYSVDITRKLLHRHKLLKNLGTGQSSSSISSSWSEDTFCDAIENLILSTDMVYHYELQEQLGLLEDLLTTSDEEQDDDDDDAYYSWDDDFELEEEHRRSLSRILLHAADISNTVRPWPISKQWSDLIVQEFFQQGDVEKAAGLEVSPGMDRDQSTQPNISLKFGDFVVQPYFEALAALLPSARIFLNTLAENRCEWERLKDCPQPCCSISTERQFPSSLLPPQPIPNPSGRRVSVAAGMVVIPEDRPTSTIRKRQRSSLMLNGGHRHHRRPLGLRSASHSGTAPDTRRRIPIHWASADLLKPIVFESSSPMLYHPQDKHMLRQIV